MRSLSVKEWVLSHWLSTAASEPPGKTAVPGSVVGWRLAPAQMLMIPSPWHLPAAGRELEAVPLELGTLPIVGRRAVL